MYTDWFNKKLAKIVKHIGPRSLRVFGTECEGIIELPQNFHSGQTPEFIDTLGNILRQNKYINGFDYSIDILLNIIKIKLFIDRNHEDFIKAKHKICEGIYNDYLLDTRNNKLKKKLQMYILLNDQLKITVFDFDYINKFTKSKGFKGHIIKYLPYEQSIRLIFHYDN